jgi:hypothetical protein
VEYRNDLADILLSGLPSDERDHVVGVIHETDAAVLRRKRVARDEVDHEPGKAADRMPEPGQ